MICPPDRDKSLRLVGCAETGEMGCGDEAAVQIVSPLVIGTDDAPSRDHAAAKLRPALSLDIDAVAEAGAAVPAHVVEPSKHALLVAHDEDAFARDIENAVCTRTGQFLFPADAYPLAPENALLLRAEGFLGPIPRRGERGLETGDWGGRLRRRYVHGGCIEIQCSRRRKRIVFSGSVKFI